MVLVAELICNYKSGPGNDMLSCVDDCCQVKYDSKR